MLSGSMAMSLYMVPRSTRDFDFVVNLRPEDVDEFVNYFQADFYCSKEAIIDAIERQSMFNIIDPVSGFKADFVIRKNNDYRLAEFERRQLVDFGDMQIYAVSKEDLLISKLIWIQQLQSAIQMEDIKNLSSLPDLQREYVNYWINTLNLKTFNLVI
ncbi:hypothetical protein R1T15_19815 [Mucilaginibacter sp. L3T2-6]|uniref:hypothetical protein n=2 Tax=Mucilaginibacter sp. L3T2-6 TaxID=3062491 RepID=UPI002706099D|nr:hypothetical protein [Mucilaginibacter sp. L3T2-6]MDO3644322.1 hypothetical protein [Mucilaginibacter sp. L3T2-6]MDV6216773.1 hypothetical protein [Mucilaginibacter sp. L3T2-6]